MRMSGLGKDDSGLIRHGTLLLAGALFGALCNAGFHAAVGRILPNAEYGALVAMLGIVLVVGTPMLALQNTLAHFAAHFEQAGRREEILPLFLHWAGVFAAVSAAVAAAAWGGRAGARPQETYRYLGASLVCLAGYAMLMNLDTLLAKHYFGAEAAGVFAKAATIARTAVFLPVPIATALFPKVTSTGELTDASWGLLGRALAFAGLLIAATAGVCLAFPQLPWTILYRAWPAADAALAAQLTRAMVLAMSPLALAYLLLNFEMAQRRFAWCYGLVPCGAAYVVGVARFHAHPAQIAVVVGALNCVAVALLLASVFAQRRRG